jgi:molybdate/tungstate transport system substrate-binding protein
MSRWPALVRFMGIVLTTACGSSATSGGTLIVFNAGSLARPLHAALDSFARQEGITFDQESAGSLETARKLTELGKIPDVVALADVEVIPTFLMPSHATWYAIFARNRMVVAYTDRSRYAAEVTPDTWWEVLTRDDVQVGRADPNLDPNGYRTLLVWQLAEKFYRQPGLASRLLEQAPARNVRPNEAALVALLEAGEMDYIWSYSSMAQRSGFRYVELPEAIDLSSMADSTAYAAASVRVAGKTFGDSITIQGRPISYALTIPTAAPHPDLARRFVAWLASPDGQRVLRAEKLDVLDRYVVTGDSSKR